MKRKRFGWLWRLFSPRPVNCPVCLRPFKNARGLAQHRRLSKNCGKPNVQLMSIVENLPDGTSRTIFEAQP